ncbi:MAG: ABC transporter permease [Cyanobacteria bacterium P01_H01_bin.121]
MAEISLAQAAIALGLLAVCLGLLRWQGVQLEWLTLLAFGRALLQLIILGYVLEFAFSLAQPLATFSLLGLLWLVSSVGVRNRINPKSLVLLFWVAFALLIGVGAVVLYINLGVVQPYPWYSPTFWIPLAGLALGSCLHVLATFGERLLTLIKQYRLEIETRLSLGATPTQTLKLYRTQAMRAALLPQTRLLAIAGLGSLPVFLAGALSSGVPPLIATVQQLLLLIVLLSSNVVSLAILGLGLNQICFDQDGRLRP